MQSQIHSDIFRPDGLIETIGYHPGEGLRYRKYHLARLAGSARQLGFECDLAKINAALEAAAQGDCARRLRLELAADGAFDCTCAAFPEPVQSWAITMASKRIDCHWPWLYHKTTSRAFYDEARAEKPQDIDELIFMNQDGYLCEGTISNIFLRGKDGQLLTPVRRAGLLGGILRYVLLRAGLCREAILTPHDLEIAHEIYLGNSLRGLVRAHLRR